MNFMYAYENNGYKDDSHLMSNDEKAFLEGYNQCLKDIKSNCDIMIENETETGNAKLDELLAEISKTAIKNIYDYLSGDWYEVLITFMDNRNEYEGDKPKNYKWNKKEYQPEEPEEFDDDIDDEEIPDYDLCEEDFDE